MSHEWRYLDRLLYTQQGRARLHGRFVMWFRLIDDLRCLNNPDAAAMVAEMYPPYLLVEPTCSCEDGVTWTQFLDIRSCLKGGKLSTSIVFKTEKLPFKPAQYVQLDSNRAVGPCYHVLDGLCISIVYHSSSVGAVVTALQKVLAAFMANGFSKGKLMDTVDRCLTSRVFDRAPLGADFGIKWHMHRHKLASLL
jgi:hypothetical protein